MEIILSLPKVVHPIVITSYHGSCLAFLETAFCRNKLTTAIQTAR